MIMNLRPTNITALNTIIEEMAERFPNDATQLEIVEIIREVLGGTHDRIQRHFRQDNSQSSTVRDQDENPRLMDAVLLDET